MNEVIYFPPDNTLCLVAFTLEYQRLFQPEEYISGKQMAKNMDLKSIDFCNRLSVWQNVSLS